MKLPKQKLQHQVQLLHRFNKEILVDLPITVALQTNTAELNGEETNVYLLIQAVKDTHVIAIRIVVLEKSVRILEMDMINV